MLLSLSYCSNPEKQEEAGAPQGNLSEDSLKKIIERYPDSLLAKENLLELYKQKGKINLAMKTVQAYLHQDSLNPRLHHISGIMNLEIGDSSQALSSFLTAYHINRDPSDLILIGTIFAGKNDAKSLTCADTLLKNFRMKFGKEAFLIKGIYYGGINNQIQALSCLDSALAINYAFSEASIEKGYLLKKMGRYQEAIETLQKATTLNNNLPEAYFAQAQCYEALQKKEDALEYYTKTLLYDPEDVDAQNALKRLKP